MKGINVREAADLAEVHPGHERIGHIRLDAQQRPHVQLQMLDYGGRAAIGFIRLRIGFASQH